MVLIDFSFTLAIGMNTLATKIESPSIESVSVTDDTLTIELSDWRSISVPTAKKWLEKRKSPTTKRSA
jgi:uncharacterized protein YydD (DUF2326 family)